MFKRVADAAAARKAFITLAESEGARVPTYARLCRIIAEHRELHGLLLQAPTGQRLPVLVLAAIHDVVLRHPELPLAAWYPSVTGAEPSSEDPERALLGAVREHLDEIAALIRTRQVQTNEVNRCAAWWWACSELTRRDPRPLHLVEVGASAGLNLLFDDYSFTFTPERPAGSAGSADVVRTGRADSTVQLETIVRGDPGAWPDQPLPPFSGRCGIDQNPLDPTDPDDRRWLAACVWPEQRQRFERLTAALEVAAARPPRVTRGDLVDSVGQVLDEAPGDTHVVVLSSWVLVYLERARRTAFADALAAASERLGGRGSRLSLLTLEAANVLTWMDPPPTGPDAGAEQEHASVLAATSFQSGAATATPLARCQAHLAWLEPIG